MAKKSTRTQQSPKELRKTHKKADDTSATKKKPSQVLSSRLMGMSKKKRERALEYERQKLPRMKLDEKKALDLDKLREQMQDAKGEVRKKLMARIYFETKRRKAEIRRDRKAAEARGEVVERQTPVTIDMMRTPDDTLVLEDDEEVRQANDADEFADYFAGKVTPRLLVTTGKKPSKNTILFLKEFVVVVPGCEYYPRQDFEMKAIVADAKEKGFTDVLVFTERHKKLFALYVTHLPEGPTSCFRLTGLTLGQDIKGGGHVTMHRPELIMKNFDTRLGQRVGRQLHALFPYEPEFHGRRVIVFHNQRDYIFFRHYRYIFEKDGTSTRLQEIGPRFTLKLRFLQEGTFNTTEGKFEYVWRPDMQVCRKTFFI